MPNCLTQKGNTLECGRCSSNRRKPRSCSKARPGRRPDGTPATPAPDSDAIHAVSTNCALADVFLAYFLGRRIYCDNVMCRSGHDQTEQQSPVKGEDSPSCNADCIR